MARSKAEVFFLKGKKYNCYKNGKPYFRKSVVINGKQKDFYGDGEKDAVKQIEEAKNLSQAGLNYDYRSAKVGSVIRSWLYNYKHADINIKASTFDRYECGYRLHIENKPIANCVLSKLDSATMQAYVTDLFEEDGLTIPNVRNIMKIWSMFFKWAIEEGYLLKNPCRNISMPGRKDTTLKKIEVFTEEERDQIVRYMAESRYQYDTVILLAFATGMRQGELLALKWTDISLNAIHIERSTTIARHIDKEGNSVRKREVWDPKTANAVRTIPILADTQRMLAEHKKKQAEYNLAHNLPLATYVFTNESGNLIDPSNFRMSYARMLKRAGVKYRKFHTIRHTFATEAIRRGVDVKDLQMLLGHSDISMTYRYVQSDNTSKRLAIEKMGRIVNM